MSKLQSTCLALVFAAATTGAFAQSTGGSMSSSSGSTASGSGSTSSGSGAMSSSKPMSASQTAQMKKCQAMSHDAMAKSASCTKMAKMHPEMMQGDAGH
ncbi:MAG: hypothetical protein ABI056_06515 [Caulobacteraceae bacterium]